MREGRAQKSCSCLCISLVGLRHLLRPQPARCGCQHGRAFRERLWKHLPGRPHPRLNRSVFPRLWILSRLLPCSRFRIFVPVVRCALLLSARLASSTERVSVAALTATIWPQFASLVSVVERRDVVRINLKVIAGAVTKQDNSAIPFILSCVKGIPGKGRHQNPPKKKRNGHLKCAPGAHQ